MIRKATPDDIDEVEKGSKYYYMNKSILLIPFGNPAYILRKKRLKTL